MANKRFQERIGVVSENLPKTIKLLFPSGRKREQTKQVSPKWFPDIIIQEAIPDPEMLNVPDMIHNIIPPSFFEPTVILVPKV